MAESAASALPGARFDGMALVEEAGLVGMITLRARLDAPEVAQAVEAVVGQGVPGQRGLAMAEGRGVAWMAPDELMLMLPHGEVAEAITTLEAALEGVFATVADVSDARAVFRIRGPRAGEVLIKLCPVDIAALQPGEIRRTRAAQVAAAIWVSGEQEFGLICFRSVAAHVFDLLSTAAAPGGEVLAD